ncbi:MAG: exonuclease domain-containing protein [Bacillota bacterium]|nr:exonuclease domain-containing protein [Bacillota bacterium]
MRYAVLDVETTGIYPGGHDRIVEVAVVVLGTDLTVSIEFTSLFNPQRDLGPSWLHGVRAADILEAPAFGDLAGTLVEHLRDAVIVGHNVTFDLRFLESEFARAGAPIRRPPYFDTMSAALGLGAPSRRLAEACELFGIPLLDAHSALVDARATAALFARCCDHLGAARVDTLVRWPDEPQLGRWPAMETRKAPWPRAQAAARHREEVPFLATLVRDLPVSDTDSGHWQAYYALLDRALEDRRITQDEGAALREVAVDAGLSAGDVRAANESYLKTLIAAAFHDRVLSDSERNDIEEVARLLALETIVPRLLSDAEAGRQVESVRTGGADLKGRTVCFTGAMNAVIGGARATRELATEVAQAHGMIVVKGVTKSLDYLVMADPDSLSGKAKKARDYGTRLLAEAVFWNLMGVSTDG